LTPYQLFTAEGMKKQQQQQQQLTPSHIQAVCLTLGYRERAVFFLSLKRVTVVE